MPRTLSIETSKKIGETVKLNGWVNARRNMGKIVFLDLRDRWGIVQVVCVPVELDESSQTALKDIRPEFVLEIEGLVQERVVRPVCFPVMHSPRRRFPAAESPIPATPCRPP